jgi:hypothetical protein
MAETVFFSLLLADSGQVNYITCGGLQRTLHHGGDGVLLLAASELRQVKYTTCGGEERPLHHGGDGVLLLAASRLMQVDYLWR